MFIPSRTDLKPRLTIRKPITSPVLSPILLQIYCIGLIGPISYSFWVWATICDLTVTILIMYIVAFYSDILIFFLSPLLLSSEYLFLCLSLLFTLTKTYNPTPPISKHIFYPIATTTKTCYKNGKLTQNQTINGKPITQTQTQTQTQNQNQTQWRKRDLGGKRDISINGKPISSNPNPNLNLVEREI